MNAFSGKKILITGASSGIGKATALFLASRGATIVGVDVNREGLNILMGEMALQNYSLIPVCGNLLDENLEYVFKEACADCIKLDGMVHCAGVSSIVPIKALTKERLHKVMDLNCFAFIELARCFSKKAYSDGGVIVGVSSLAAVKPRAFEIAYITSKAALNAAIECLAIELAPKRVRVNGIMPGVVNTTMINTQQSEEQRTFIENMTKQTLLGAANPEEISSVVSFLLSDESSIITGRIIPADGGMFL